MPAARSLSRPTRRSLLLSGAVLTPLGLAGCDPEGSEGVEEEPPPPRPTLTLAPMTTSEDLVPEEPVRQGSWNVSPTPRHPMAMLVSRLRSLERDLWVLTLENPEGMQIPIDPATTRVSADRHGGPVQVLAETAEGVRLRHALWRSADLESWSQTDLGAAIDRRAAAFGDGVVVSEARGGSLSVWVVGEDAEIAALSPVPVPEGQDWEVEDVACSGSTIRVLVTSTAAGEGKPGLVSSEDGGVSWAEWENLPQEGESTTAHSIRALAGVFVIVGDHEVSLEWGEERTQRRPTAWSITEGEAPIQEQIPLPAFGIDGWNHSVRGDLSMSTPVDWTDVWGTAPIADVAAGVIHCALHYGDDCRSATRAKDGHWSVSGVDAYAPFSVAEAVASPVGQILLSETRAVSRRGASEQFTSGLSFTPAWTYHRTAHGITDGIDAVLRNTAQTSERDDTHFSSTPEHSNRGLRIVEDQLEPADGLPDGASGWGWGEVHHPADGIELVTGRVPEEADSRFHLVARVRLEEDWVEVEGLELPGVFQIGTATSVEGMVYLPAAGNEEEGTSLGGIAVHASPDGISWEKQGTVDMSVAEEAEFAGRVCISSVTAMDGAIIGLGWAHDEEGVSRAVTFLRQDEIWVPQLVADLSTDSSLEAAYALGDRIWVTGVQGDRRIHGLLAADGTVSQLALSTEQELRTRILDLGDGVLLAGGWLDRSPSEADSGAQTGYGSCVWASHDDGATWTATLLPGHENRFPWVHLARDGEDVLALVEQRDAPVGYRIVDAGGQVRAAME